MSGIMCSSPTYQFEGVTFEFHRFIGPWPLKKNGDPKKYAGEKFYQLYERFKNLSSIEKEKCCIDKGGCVAI